MHSNNQETLNRRNFLKLGSASLAATLAPLSALAKSGSVESHRSLSFYNLHTGESLDTVYWEQGVYHPDALQEINHLLRDHRTDEVMEMDTALLDLLHQLRTASGRDQAFNVISGYRSPKTNAMLNRTSNGVAKKSLHMVGKAIDINLPGVPLAELRKAAIRQKTGGVGYYPKSNFVHVDTGRVRYW